MLRTSEWVSLGHPDKIADYISSYLLDRHLERDPKTRFAVEVMVKDQIVTLGGEIASEADFSDDEITQFVRNAVNEIGYTRMYQEKWGRENTICGDQMEVYPLLGRQSPDIGQGVERDLAKAAEKYLEGYNAGSLGCRDAYFRCSELLRENA